CMEQNNHEIKKIRFYFGLFYYNFWKGVAVPERSTRSHRAMRETAPGGVSHYLLKKRQVRVGITWRRFTLQPTLDESTGSVSTKLRGLRLSKSLLDSPIKKFSP
ncbi:MAG TPA: hypothetical protein VFQ70_00505, partial [Candidatus Saccharimonadaceae bacterium]|nr:hypothetical protein [Candidatus Saccharimonadaceae bacterium]